MVARLKLLALAALCLCATAFAFQNTPKSPRIAKIQERGVLRVGTTGDYRPFSYLTADGTFEGLDIDMAQELGDALGVEIELVKTTWPTLVQGLLMDRYDIAMSGITRTKSRLELLRMSAAYIVVGKSLLIRTSDIDVFTSLAEVDQPDVRVGVNPGGTNEAFVRTRLERATIIVINDNMRIPDAIRAGEVDVMITDNVEAVLRAQEHPELHAVAPDRPFTRDGLAYLLPKDDALFQRWVDDWLSRMESSGKLERLTEEWIPTTSPALTR